MAGAPPGSVYAVVDLETTGLNRDLDEVVSYAVAHLNARGEILGARSFRLRPRRPIPAVVSQVHGIRAENVADAPRFEGVVDSIAQELADCVFVAHNAAFDLGLLRTQCGRHRVTLEPAQVLCTRSLGRALWPDAQGHGLAEVCSYAGVPYRAEDAHDADADVRFVAGILRAVIAQGYDPLAVVDGFDEEQWTRRRELESSELARPAQWQYLLRDAHRAKIPRGELAQMCADLSGKRRWDQVTRADMQRLRDALHARIQAAVVATPQ